MTTEQLMRAVDAAKQIGIHKSTLIRWVEIGRATPRFIVPGYKGQFLFSVAEVERLEREYLARKATKQMIAELKQQLQAS